MKAKKHQGKITWELHNLTALLASTTAFARNEGKVRT